MGKVVTGVFVSRAAAEAAATELDTSGFGPGDVSLMMSDGALGREWGIEKSSKASEGAAAGAATGGLLGALVSGLVAVGTLATGGAGVIAAGPLVAALAGAGAGAGAGGVLGALIGAGIPEHEAKLLEGELGQGKILIGVHTTDNRVEVVKETLLRHGGSAISVTG